MEKREESVGMTENYRPRVNLVGRDGNVFSIIGEVSETLKKSGLRDSADEFVENSLQCDSYNDVIKLAFKYVNLVIPVIE